MDRVCFRKSEQVYSRTPTNLLFPTGKVHSCTHSTVNEWDRMFDLSFLPQCGSTMFVYVDPSLRQDFACYWDAKQLKNNNLTAAISFGRQQTSRSSLCTRTFHHTNYKVQVLDGRMPATEMYTVCTIPEYGMQLTTRWLNGHTHLYLVNSHSSCQVARVQRSRRTRSTTTMWQPN